MGNREGREKTRKWKASRRLSGQVNAGQVGLAVIPRLGPPIKSEDGIQGERLDHPIKSDDDKLRQKSDDDKSRQKKANGFVWCKLKKDFIDQSVCIVRNSRTPGECHFAGCQNFRTQSA